MSTTVNANTLCKIVYYDEESISDYIQIDNGGLLEKTEELLKDTLDKVAGEAGVTAKLGFSGLIKALIGNEASASAKAEADTYYTHDKMVKNVIKNTILTDFINIIRSKSENTNNAIEIFKGYVIEAPKESLSYVAMISPYLGMLRGVNIPAGEYNIATDKLDNTIKSAKGYYEFLGVKKLDEGNVERVIFRFNMKSFKNNYKPIDLLRMDLSIYAIKVGKSSIDMLDFSNEFKIGSHLVDNPSYDNHSNSGCDNNDNIDTTKMLDIYDVLLAGVEFGA